MRVLALDFDGVISDSAPECFAVAMRTFAALRPDSAIAAQAGPFLGSGAPPLGEVLAAPLYPPFLALMPLGNRAEDYGVALAALEAGRALPDQERYDAFRKEQPEALQRAFHARFYRERHGLSERDPDGWQRLMAPYPHFVALLRRRAGDAVLTLATAKDRRSVRALLVLYGLSELFPDERLLDKEEGRDKAAHLEAIRSRLGVAFQQILFVDDKVNHLESVRPLGVHCALAGWGYNGEREIQRARTLGIPVLAPETAEAALFD